MGGGLAGYRAARLVGGVEQFEFVALEARCSAPISILVAGLADKEGGAVAERGLARGLLTYTAEQYILRWETRYVLKFSHALSSFLADVAVSTVAEEAIQYTALCVAHCV